MKYKNSVSLLLISLCALCSLGARKHKRSQAPREVCGNNEQRCKDLSDQCQCYCAFKPGPRDKVADDKPIFIEDDLDGIYCYCKQRDIDKHRADKEAQTERE